MNKITIVYSYYNSQQVIPILVNNWNSWDEEVRKHVTVIVVDDGSRISFAELVKLYNWYNFNIEIYQILEDIKWNQAGAFNLGFSQANTEWIMNMPVDRLIPNDTIKRIINSSLNNKFYYLMKDILHGSFIGYPAGIMLLTKRAFIDCGKFDEDFCGNYGHDDILFRNYLDKICKPVITDWCIEVLPEVGHMHGLTRDTSVNKKLMDDKVAGIIQRSTDICRFKWKKIENEA